MAKWSIPFDELAARTGKKVETVVRMVTIDIFSACIKRSPVDYGTFRANWNCSFNAINSEVSTAKTDDPTEAMKQAVMTYAVGGTVYLCNSLPYAQVLEYGGYPNPPKFGSHKRSDPPGRHIHVEGGFSLQAPNGMVRLSAVEFYDAVMLRLDTVDADGNAT